MNRSQFNFYQQPSLLKHRAHKTAIDADRGARDVAGFFRREERHQVCELARFPNEGGLQAMGENLFSETAGSGAVLTGLPGSPGFGTLQQGYLETSNVNAVQEITDLITAQRAYEMNSKVISAADQMLQITSKMS